MQATANYGLKKPEGNDTVDIDVINGNVDTIDGQLKKLSSAMGDDPDFKTTLSNAISVKTNQTDFSSHVNALTAHGIGDRTQLKTAAKDTIVNALNELKTAIPSVPVQSINGKTGSVSLGASDITVSDSSNHFSSNPKNVENVLAELFQSASSGKSAIATATGSPSTSSETFNQLASDITNGKNNIYNAIVAKGTTPVSKNFSDLANAVENASTSSFSKAIQGADPLRIRTNRASISNGDYYAFDSYTQNTIQRKRYNNSGTLLETVNLKTGTWPAASIKIIPYMYNRLLIAPNSSTYMTPGVYDWNGTLITSYAYPHTDPFYIVAIFEDGSYMARVNDTQTTVWAYDAAGTLLATISNATESAGQLWQYSFRTLTANAILFTVGGVNYYYAYHSSSQNTVNSNPDPLNTFQYYL